MNCKDSIPAIKALSALILLEPDLLPFPRTKSKSDYNGLQLKSSQLTGRNFDF